MPNTRASGSYLCPTHAPLDIGDHRSPAETIALPSSGTHDYTNTAIWRISQHAHRIFLAIEKPISHRCIANASPQSSLYRLITAGSSGSSVSHPSLESAPLPQATWSHFDCFFIFHRTSSVKIGGVLQSCHATSAMDRHSAASIGLRGSLRAPLISGIYRCAISASCSP